MSPNRQSGKRVHLHYETTRVSSHHEKLNVLYADLQVELDAGQWQDALVHFCRMKDGLEAHFEVEEQVYFPAVHGLLPDRGALLDDLTTDHARFREQLERIEESIREGNLDSGRRDIPVLVERLRRHEQGEERLFEDVQAASAKATSSDAARESTK